MSDLCVSSIRLVTEIFIFKSHLTINAISYCHEKDHDQGYKHGCVVFAYFFFMFARSLRMIYVYILPKYVS